MTIESLIATYVTIETTIAFLIGLGLFLILSTILVRKIKKANYEMGASSRSAEVEALSLENGSLMDQVASLNGKNTELATNLAQATTRAERLPKLEGELEQLRADLAVARGNCIQLETRISEQQAQNEKNLELLNNAKSQMTDQFKILANEILDEKSKKFTDQNRSNLTSLIKPVKEQLRLFEEKFIEGQNKDIEGRTEIKAEIRQLRKLNEQISLEADSLTKALKGDSKTQGTWGELILDKVFEGSGLEKGREYDIQVNLKNSESKSSRPDAIVHLPEGKDIVVDSKVSLTDYERYYAATDETKKQEAMKKHVASVRSHIKNLSSKNYQQIESIQTLDFVLMFVPIDAALTDALREAPELFEEALSKNIGLVSPSSMMLTLRTIEHIWRSDRQNKNALAIASRGGKLYDKFVGFVADLEKVGDKIQQTQDAYHGATNKLVDGQGNLMRQAEILKELGAKTSKSLQASVQLGYEPTLEGISEIE